MLKAQKIYIENFLSEMHETLVKKGKDYSGEEDTLKNFKTLESFGYSPESVVLGRISDKFSRLAVILRKDTEPEYESLRDTCLDLANYAVLLSLVLEERRMVKH